MFIGAKLPAQATRTHYSYRCCSHYIIPSKHAALQVHATNGARVSSARTTRCRKVERATHRLSGIIQAQDKYVDLRLGEEIPEQASDERELE